MTKRRYDPWTRLRRHLGHNLRRDLRLATQIGQRLDLGADLATILAELGLTEDDASSLAQRITEATRAARIRLEPDNRLAHVIATIDREAA